MKLKRFDIEFDYSRCYYAGDEPGLERDYCEAGLYLDADEVLVLLKRLGHNPEDYIED